ncbi:hypothetical protein AgCh_000239 [Apium graveolens]
MDFLGLVDKFFYLSGRYDIQLTVGDVVMVRVTTVLGSAAPPLSVKLMQVFSSGSKDASIIDQELTFDSENGIHILEALPESVDVGMYTFVFEALQEWTDLPTGMKFNPTDVELLDHLAAKGRVGTKKYESNAHYFYESMNTYAIGKTKPVMENGVTKGYKKILVLYSTVTKGCNPVKTKWVMHQYHLGNKDDKNEDEYVVSKVFYQHKQVEKIVLHDAELKKFYATGGRTKVPIFVTGVMQVDNAKIAVLDSDR